MVKVARDLVDLYEDYYSIDPFEDQKRDLAAADSVRNIIKVGGTDLGRTLDVGAGDGAVSQKVSAAGIASAITALEISQSGLDKIQARSIPELEAAIQFDGYVMPFDDREFDSIICAHVIEHVEHERVFLAEVRRVARKAFFVMPLEGGMRGRINRTGGHINYYSPMTIVNLLETSGFKVSRKKIFTASVAYEAHIYGPLSGTIRNSLRRIILRVAGEKAPHIMAYFMAIECYPTEASA